MDKKACIYHFSANSESKICRKHLIEITEYANRKGYDIEEVYIDSSLKQSEKTEHTRMLGTAEKYNCLFLRDLFHLNKWTVKCMAYVKNLQEQKTLVSSMHSGDIILENGKSDFMKEKKILFYHSKVNMSDEREYSTQKAIVELFCREKTKWTIVDSIYEEYPKKSVHGQPKLWGLGNLAGKYDLVIVQSFGRLDLQTARFEKIVNLLNVDVYSLQEGLLKIRKE